MTKIANSEKETQDKNSTRDEGKLAAPNKTNCILVAVSPTVVMCCFLEGRKKTRDLSSLTSLTSIEEPT